MIQMKLKSIIFFIEAFASWRLDGRLCVIRSSKIEPGLNYFYRPIYFDHISHLQFLPDPPHPPFQNPASCSSSTKQNKKQRTKDKQKTHNNNNNNPPPPKKAHIKVCLLVLHFPSSPHLYLQSRTCTSYSRSRLYLPFGRPAATLENQSHGLATPRDYQASPNQRLPDG